MIPVSHFLSAKVFKLPLLIVVLATLMITTSCSSRRVFDTPYNGDVAPDRIDTIEKLSQITAERAPVQPLFWGRADVTLHDQNQNRKYRFDATLIYGEPDRMRIRGNHFLIGNLFEIVMGGSESWVYIAKDRVLYEGTTDELQHQGGIFGSLSPDELIGAIRVFHEMDELLSSTAPIRLTESNDYLYLVADEPGRTILRKIRKADGLVEEILLLDPRQDDRIVLKIQYWEYELFGDQDQVFPTDMDIVIPDYDINVRLEVTDLKLDPAIRPEVITSLPRRIDNRFPLEALSQQEPVLPEE